jgi:hypothetical protein
MCLLAHRLSSPCQQVRPTMRYLLLNIVRSRRTFKGISGLRVYYHKPPILRISNLRIKGNRVRQRSLRI